MQFDIRDFITIVVSVIGAVSGLLAVRNQLKIETMKQLAEKDKVAVEANKSVTDFMQQVSETSISLIEPLQLRLETSDKIANEYREKLNKVLEDVGEIKTTNIELQRQNIILLQKNSELEVKIKELSDIIECLVVQIQELGYTPRMNKKGG